MVAVRRRHAHGERPVLLHITDKDADHEALKRLTAQRGIHVKYRWRLRRPDSSKPSLDGVVASEVTIIVLEGGAAVKNQARHRFCYQQDKFHNRLVISDELTPDEVVGVLDKKFVRGKPFDYEAMYGVAPVDLVKTPPEPSPEPGPAPAFAKLQDVADVSAAIAAVKPALAPAAPAAKENAVLSSASIAPCKNRKDAGVLLQKERLKWGLSCDEVAKALTCSGSYIAAYERGNGSMNGNSCRAFEVFYEFPSNTLPRDPNAPSSKKMSVNPLVTARVLAARKTEAAQAKAAPRAPAATPATAAGPTPPRATVPAPTPAPTPTPAATATATAAVPTPSCAPSPVPAPTPAATPTPVAAIAATPTPQAAPKKKVTEAEKRAAIHDDLEKMSPSRRWMLMQALAQQLTRDELRTFVGQLHDMAFVRLGVKAIHATLEPFDYVVSFQGPPPPVS